MLNYQHEEVLDVVENDSHACKQEVPSFVLYGVKTTQLMQIYQLRDRLDMFITMLMLST